MTDAKVLADALCEAGIVRFDVYDERYSVATKLISGEPEEIITDWRVAGKVLELMNQAYINIGWDYISEDWQVKYKGFAIENESLPLAIIEAWYAAL